MKITNSTNDDMNNHILLGNSQSLLRDRILKESMMLASNPIHHDISLPYAPYSHPSFAIPSVSSYLLSSASSSPSHQPFSAYQSQIPFLGGFLPINPTPNLSASLSFNASGLLNHNAGLYFDPSSLPIQSQTTTASNANNNSMAPSMLQPPAPSNNIRSYMMQHIDNSIKLNEPDTNTPIHHHHHQNKPTQSETIDCVEEEQEKDEPIKAPSPPIPLPTVTEATALAPAPTVEVNPRSVTARVDFKKLKPSAIEKYLWYYGIDRDTNSDSVSAVHNHFVSQLSHLLTRSTTDNNSNNIAYGNGDSSSSSSSSSSSFHHRNDFDDDVESKILPSFFETLDVYEARRKRNRYHSQLANKTIDNPDGTTSINREHLFHDNIPSSTNERNQTKETGDMNGKQRSGNHNQSNSQMLRLQNFDNSDQIRASSRFINSAHNTIDASKPPGNFLANLERGGASGVGKRNAAKRRRDIDGYNQGQSPNFISNGASKANAVLNQEIIPPGRYTAAYIDGTWVLTRVLKFNKKTRHYIVEDADESAKGRPATFAVPKHHVQQLLTEDESSSIPRLPTGLRVLAMYPQTTSFYPAIVVNYANRKPKNRYGNNNQPYSNNNGNAYFDYILQFDDDKDEFDKLTTQRVASNLVVSCDGIEEKLLKVKE